ncbi:plasmid mobilization protein [Mesonia maritima]|uniref:Mobilization protein n=1 Tax=Mesonia maritima TaxID=1793873 RepID=A0ABU1K4H6_9FLAO|nr:hypothetical protein [Mesonia maritima]MDR6299417.1 hypothetical protein [Mesonia maritima]
MKKNHRIQLRLTAIEKTAIEMKAKKYETSITQVVISATLNKPIPIKWEPDEQAEKLKNELSIIGRNLWMLIKYKKKFQLSEQFKIQEIINELLQLVQKINQYYDRKSETQS